MGTTDTDVLRLMVYQRDGLVILEPHDPVGLVSLSIQLELLAAMDLQSPVGRTQLRTSLLETANGKRWLTAMEQLMTPTLHFRLMDAELCDIHWELFPVGEKGVLADRFIVTRGIHSPDADSPRDWNDAFTGGRAFCGGWLEDDELAVQLSAHVREVGEAWMDRMWQRIPYELELRKSDVLEPLSDESVQAAYVVAHYDEEAGGLKFADGYLGLEDLGEIANRGQHGGIVIWNACHSEVYARRMHDAGFHVSIGAVGRIDVADGMRFVSAFLDNFFSENMSVADAMGASPHRFQDGYFVLYTMDPEARWGSVPEQPDVQSTTSVAFIIPGRYMEDGRESDEVHWKLSHLTRHTAITGSTGSGKTILAKRIIEQAALQGIPSIVLDFVKGDLISLGVLDRDLSTTRWISDEKERVDFATYRNNWGIGPEAVGTFSEQVRINVFSTDDAGIKIGKNFIPLPPSGYSSFLKTEREACVQQVVHGILDDLMPFFGTIHKGVRDYQWKGYLEQVVDYLYRENRLQGQDYQTKIRTFIDVFSDPPFNRVGQGEQPLAEFFSIRKGRDPKGAVRQFFIPLKTAIYENILKHAERNYGEVSLSDIDGILNYGAGSDSRTPINIVNLATDRRLALNTEDKFNALSDVFGGLLKWAESQPRHDFRPRFLFFIDEIGYGEKFAANRRSRVKQQLADILRTVRSKGVGVVLSTQYPKEIDPNMRNNINTYFTGRHRNPKSSGTVHADDGSTPSRVGEFVMDGGGRKYLMQAGWIHSVPVDMVETADVRAMLDELGAGQAGPDAAGGAVIVDIEKENVQILVGGGLSETRPEAETTTGPGSQAERKDSVPLTGMPVSGTVPIQQPVRPGAGPLTGSDPTKPVQGEPNGPVPSTKEVEVAKPHDAVAAVPEKLWNVEISWQGNGVTPDFTCIHPEVAVQEQIGSRVRMLLPRDTTFVLGTEPHSDVFCFPRERRIVVTGMAVSFSLTLAVDSEALTIRSTRGCRVSENRNIEIGTHIFQIKMKGGRKDG